MNKIFKKTSLFGKISLVTLIFFLAITAGISPSIVSGQDVNPVGTSNPTQNAQTEYTLLEPLPCVNGNGVNCTAGTQVTKVNFKDYVQYMFNLLIALAAVAAVFMIVLGGFEYMTSESSSVKSGGLKKVQNAVIGLLLILSAFLILRTVDPRLVEIPGTLVKPLDIKYNADEISSFFAQLNSDAQKLRQENMGLIRNVAAAQKEIAALDATKSSLCDQFKKSENASANTPNLDGNFSSPANTSYSCDDLVKISSSLSVESRALAAQIANIDNQKHQLQTLVATQQARGVMNAEIQKCNGVTTNSSNSWFSNAGNGYTVGQCLGEIADSQTKYAKILRDSGATVEAAQVEDYAKYATSIAKINTTILVNMSNSPAAQELINYTQNVVTAAGTAYGAVLGGAIGGAGGFVGAQAFNGIVINGLRTASNVNAANLTVSQIQLEVNNVANTITDQKVREQYVAQANVLMKNLGGKGDGTDSTAAALKRIEDGKRAGVYTSSELIN